MLSIPHMIVVFIVVLVVFGPQKLPELARGLGKLMAEFRKASFDFKTAFEEEMRDLERQAREVERRKAEAAAPASTPSAQPATPAPPSGLETQPATPQLASRADAQAAEDPVVQPVTESVARSAESSDGGEVKPVEHSLSSNPSEATHERQ